MCLLFIVRGGVDKSLARSTSRCCRTESIVSLERGVYSYAELQVSSSTGAERKHVRRRAQFQQHRGASCHQVCSLHDKAAKEIRAILKETLGEHAPSYGTVKNWVVQFKRGDFFLVLDDPKQ